MPCAECTQREKQCTYQRLLGDEPSLSTTSQASSETQRAESLLVIDGGGDDADARKAAESSWDLGPATLYPSSLEIFARRHNIPLGSAGSSAIRGVQSNAGG
jgi:hypothetical protein